MGLEHDQTNKNLGCPLIYSELHGSTPEEDVTLRLSGDNGLHLER
jgi:hypothetical protein